MRKSTEQLMNELKNTTDIGDFLSKNQNEMLDLSLSEYLRQLLGKYNLEK